MILSIEDYAKLVGLAGQVAPLKSELAATNASLANMTEQRDAAVALAATRAETVAALRELAEIRKQRAEEEKARGDRLASQRRKEGFVARVKERALEGALLGTVGGTALPGVGNVLGGLAGGAIGAVVGAIESVVSGP